MTAPARDAGQPAALPHARRLRLPGSGEIDVALLSAPAILAILLFFMAPLAGIFVLSVTEPTTGLDNYCLLLTSGGIQRVLARTFRLSFLTTLFAVALGYLVAYVLAASTPRRRQVMLFFIVVPFWVSALARAFAWILLLGREGPVNAALLGAGLIGEPLNILYSETGVTIGMIHYMLPYAILPLYAAMKDMDPQILLASRGLGAGPFATFRHVFLPLTGPAVLGTFTLVFVYCLGFYVMPVVIGGGRVLMVAQYISMNVHDTVRWGVASMLSATLLVSVLLLAAAGQQGQRLAQRAGRP